MTLAEITDSTDLEFVEKIKTELEAIPDERWTINVRHSSKNQHCAYGHLDNIDHRIGGKVAGFHGNGHLGDRLWGISKVHFPPQLAWNQQCIIAEANNGDHPDYNQSTPKERTLAVLSDLIAKMSEIAIEN